MFAPLPDTALFDSPLPEDPPSVVQSCPSDAGLYSTLRQKVADAPQLAVVCLPQLKNAHQRDQILRLAFAGALTKQPKIARLLLPEVAGRPWLGEVGFFPAAAFARQYAAEAPAECGALLMAAARRYPALALREFLTYQKLPVSGEIFDTAARLAPDQAVAVAQGDSVLAQAARARLSAGPPELVVLARLATDGTLDPPTRERVALFHQAIAKEELPLQKAVRLVQSGPDYFTALADARIKAKNDDALPLDRALETYAQTLFRSVQDGPAGQWPAELQRLPARAVYLLLTYGRTEEDDLLFGSLFDRLLLPKLRSMNSRQPVQQLVREVDGLYLRAFLATTIAHQRLGPLMKLAGTEPDQAALLARALQGIGGSAHPLEEAVAASEILGAVNGSLQWRRVSATLLSEKQALQQSPERSDVLYGLLAARAFPAMQAAGLATGDFRRIASQYQPYFHEVRSIDPALLFNHENTCVQRHFFYNDDDGVESYDSFRQTYQSDPSWKWEQREGFVHLTGKGANGRRIEIYANIPVDVDLASHRSQAAAINARQDRLTEFLTSRKLQPSVIVHRGHSFHVGKTLPYLSPAAKLVYLGSCRGMENLGSVLESARDAQLIATRGVGTLSLNDPLLKSINDALLRTEGPLDWGRFWQGQSQRWQKHPLFAGYLPPHQNAAAILLSAYYNYLDQTTMP